MKSAALTITLLLLRLSCAPCTLCLHPLRLFVLPLSRNLGRRSSACCSLAFSMGAKRRPEKKSVCNVHVMADRECHIWNVITRQEVVSLHRTLAEYSLQTKSIRSVFHSPTITPCRNPWKQSAFHEDRTALHAVPCSSDHVSGTSGGGTWNPLFEFLGLSVTELRSFWSTTYDQLA